MARPLGSPNKDKPFRDALRMAIADAEGDNKALRRVAEALVGKAMSGDVAAIKEVEDRQTFSIEKGGRKTTKDYTARTDDALAFLKILASGKLSDDQRKEICTGLGLLDFPDLQLSARLADTAKGVRRARRNLEKKYGSLTPAVPANPGPIGKFFSWLNRVFPV